MEDELDKKLNELAREQGFIDIEDMLYCKRWKFKR